MHGHALIPPDYANAHDVGWVEAGRWIARNAKLFSKGKLTDKRYQLIRDILGAGLTPGRTSGCRPSAGCWLVTMTELVGRVMQSSE